MSTDGFEGMNPHRRILASAGTGKTYRLVGRYLELVMSVEDPSTILATTFTRKAAAEIRDRVLQGVAESVLGEPARLKQAKQIHGNFLEDDAPGLDDEAALLQAFTHADACQLLKTLTDKLHRLQICTLDSLFGRIVRGLGERSPLPVDAVLLEPGEERELLNLAIQDALGEGNEDSLLETLEGLGRGEGPASLVPLIERSLKDVLESAEDAEDSAWSWPLPKAPTAEMIDPLEQALRALAEQAGSPFPNGINTLFSKLEQAMRDGGQAWADVAVMPILKAAAEGGTYSKKPIPDEMVKPLKAIGEVVASANARVLALRTAAIKDLVDRVGPRLVAHKQALGVATFQDVVRALDPDRHATQVDFDELWFRLDAGIQHVLLDEFQDTSMSQWRAIRPLVHEITGHADESRSFLAVGDLKQSIYGWRGGEPRLLADLQEIASQGIASLQDLSLSKSYRSGPAVLEAVNTVFGGIDTNSAAVQASDEAAKAFASSFEIHTTERSGYEGESRLEILPNPTDSETASAVAVREAARAAEELVGRHGLIDKDGRPAVAVLVRRNKMVAPIVRELRTRDIPASGLGGGSLGDADAAVVVLQALRMAASPLDSIAAYDVACSPLGRVLEMPEPGPHQALSLDVREAVSARVREELHREGPAALVDRWRRQLERQQELETREGVRLRQLVEFFEGLGRESHEPEELVELARQARVDDPGAEGVVVMNIHQAKGLEFEGVVLADIEEGLRGQVPQLARRQPTRPDDRLPEVCTWYREGARPAAAEPAHADTITRTVRESLCMLYVAMTRARRDLIMQVRPVTLDSKGKEETKSSQTSVAGVLRAALGAGDRDAIRTKAEVVWPPRSPGEPAPDLEKKPGSLERAASPGHSRPQLALLQGDQGPKPAGRSRDFFAISNRDATDRGSAIHACLARVGWLEDGHPTDEALRGAIRGAAGRRNAAWVDQRLGEFKRYLELPEVIRIFQKPPGSAILRREHAILGHSGGTLRRHVLDRLVVHLDAAGEPEAASIIDFKTDRSASGSPTAVLESHGSQLERYRQVVVEQLGLPA
ncbi:MAG: UvrD-helicase domain-containing protein, partial [Phycisphaerales bacterium]|nr:UvrD-helicase domain-containing protein [Phycisphaerales bacterium]